MTSITESHQENFDLLFEDILDLDPELLNAIAGGSGGDECCANPRVSMTCYQGGGCTPPVVDCSDWRSC